jgi:hypothetical protein
MMALEKSENKIVKTMTTLENAIIKQKTEMERIIVKNWRVPEDD